MYNNSCSAIHPVLIWTATASFESVHECINIDFDGLKKDLIDMIAGLRVRVNTATFENHTDRSAFNSKDNVFTYLIHLGYLAWDSVKNEAFIPNEEIRQVIGQEVSESRWTEFDSFEKESLTLLDQTIAKDGEKVASGIEQIHDRFSSSIWYNNESSLAAAITIGYLATLRYYFKPVREMPAGKGFADIVYVPRPDYRQDYPALVIELKWDKDVQTAIDQIRMKHYPESLSEYTGNILLVGISYNRKTKKHSCIIEETAL